MTGNKCDPDCCINDNLKERLIHSVFHFKRMDIKPPPGIDLNFGEIMFLKHLNTGHYPPHIMESDKIHDMLNVTKPAVSQMLKSLEKKGYIIREIDPQDRRKIVIKTTAEGDRLTNEMKRFSEDLITEVIRRFGDENTEKLIDLFDRFHKVIDEIRCEMNKKTEERNTNND